ncbi:Hint domain-containing protein [Profundibacter sp.]|uniref:Hint domain-containing protein n=1 Tax=Profundibacter sp. TaxID=3101071 RepID=UPI003D09B5D8
MDNNPNDQFSINGGAPQTFDGTAIYNATITYIDGTTATITAVVYQDVNGNTYLAPEFSANADQTALEAGAIRSISLDSLAGNNYSGLTSSRETWNYVTCFVRGTKIETADGPVAVEDLKTGDMVRTVDNGLQPLRWIGRRTVPAENAFAPILIRKGALGNTEDLRVSPQHRVLLSGWRAEINLGLPEVLAPAKSLINGETILRETGGEVEYFHIMFDRHELVYAAGIESESFHPGDMGWNALTDETREEILTLFPELRDEGVKAYGATARPTIKSREAQMLS